MALFAQLTSFRDPVKAMDRPLTAQELPISASAGRHPPRGAYVHVPFCLHKCHYCDFYSFVDTRRQQPAFTRRLVEEMEAASEFLTKPLETVFVGGGTPTLLEVALWRELLEAMDHLLPREPGAEFTVEANPETGSAELMDVLAAGGVNRMSVGAQSFQRQHLETLERRHEPANVGRSMRLARAAGIVDLNLDLIFAIPGQHLGEWLADLDAALALEPTHLSCYSLMYEPNTPLTAKMRAGEVKRVDEDLEAEMYEAAIDRLAAAGFEHYEVSNWARPGHRCRHNLLYWRNEPWWPLGPSASGHVEGIRWKNAPHLGDYLRVRPWPPITDVERLDEDGRVGEALMLGLRLMEGVTLDQLDGLLAVGVRGPHRTAAIDRHIAAGLLRRSATHLHLTRRGLLLADTVLADLL